MGHQGAEEEKGDILRLSRALVSGTGHVAVIAEDRATARGQARKALIRVETAAVVHVAAAGVESPADAAAAGHENNARARVRSLMAPLLAQARAVEKPAFVVVDDADSAGAAALERIRIAVECAPDAIKWLRIVLVGGDGLERVLSDPEASALASRLCARVRVAPQPTTPLPEHASHASTPLRAAALAAFAIAFVSLGAWSYFMRSAPQPAPQAATSEREQVVVARAVPAHTEANAIGAETAARNEPSRVEPVPSPRMLVETAPAESVPTAESVPGDPGHARMVPIEPLHAATSDTLKAPAVALPPAAAKTKRSMTPIVAKRSEPIRSPHPVASARATKAETVPLSREVVLQVGSFEDARRAYALRNELRGSVDHALVARLESVAGAPKYSVRVVGLESYREVARAEDAIHALGHETQRLSEPGPLKRLGRSWRPFLASLFGN